MADKIRIEINHASVAALLKGGEIQADLARRAAAIAAAATGNAGPGAVFGHDSSVGRNRARASVWTESFEAMHAEATTRALTRSIDAGRG